MIYVQDNEITNTVKIVTVLQPDQVISEKFLSDIEVLDRMYPDIKIDFITMYGNFSPELLDQILKD